MVRYDYDEWRSIYLSENDARYMLAVIAAFCVLLVVSMYTTRYAAI